MDLSLSGSAGIFVYNNKMGIKARLQGRFFDFVISSSYGFTIFYFIFGGLSNLNPRNIQWIHGDNTLSYVAQLFYLSDSWRFPIGSNPNYGLDLSTSLTYSGPPLPLMLAQKFAGINPELQFFGIYLLLIIILQVFLGIAIGRTLGASTFQAYLIGFIQVTPFFLYRLQFHFWISSHFLILWSLWIVVRYLKDTKLRIAEAAILAVSAYFIGAYLLAMCLFILTYPVVKEWFKSRDLSIQTKKYVFSTLICLFSSYLIADFGVQKGSVIELLRMNFTGQYTYYPTNLLSIFNPEVGYARDCNIGHCIFGSESVPSHIIENFSITGFDLGGTQGNFDGFLYLGMGIILLLMISSFFHLRSRNLIAHIELLKREKLALIYGLFLLIFSVTYRITLGSLEFNLLDSRYIRWALSTFRASGRFAWILAYTLIVLSIAVLLKRAKSRHVTLVLLFAFLLQIIDLSKPIENRFFNIRTHEYNSIPKDQNISSEFRDIAIGKKILAYYPPAGMKGWPMVSILAWENNMKSGMIATSRVNYAQAARSKEDLRDMICQDRLPGDWIVAVPVEELKDLEVCMRKVKTRYSISEILIPEPPFSGIAQINFIARKNKT